jgi:hypothetical protein
MNMADCIENGDSFREVKVDMVMSDNSSDRYWMLPGRRCMS